MAYQSEKFNNVYSNLNAQQKKAVDAIEGPVMVIAGPGTGKTQILAARIGKILIETDTQPENILCLTYTDAGAVAMRKRLTEFLGAAAYKINICTYHAFCNDVIQDNLYLFEKTNLDAVSELEKTDFFIELIDAFPKNHPLKRYRGDVYFEISNLQSLFRTMKLEGWTPAFLNERIDAYINSLPQRDEYIAKRAVKNFKKGELRTDKIEDEIEKVNKLRAAVNEFDNFQKILAKNKRYDFDDMINWVTRAFSNNENLLRQYQEQYLYILVDEYQDTNGSQNKLVQQLINFWDVPNVFVVGDDDQSIYRFQGANVENMLSFARRYEKDLLTVVLTDNYRSSQPILNVAKTLIEKNNERLINKIPGLSKVLTAANAQVNTLTQPPRILEYASQLHEMADITLQAEKLIQQGVQPGAIAVIYRENKYGEEMAQFFAMKNIPVYSKRSINILTLPLVQKIILMLQYLHAEHDAPDGGDEMLFEILHHSWFKVPPTEIAKLSIEVADKQFTENKTSMRRLLYAKIKTPPKDLFSQGVDENLKRASGILESLIADVPNITLQQLLENIIRKTGLLQHLMQSSDKAEQMLVLTCFFNYVKEETSRHPFMQLPELVRNLQLMMDEDISLPMTKTTGNEKGVNLLTAHGSKGLEFEHVFIAGCNAVNWEKKRKPGGGYKLPDTVFSFATDADKETETEEMRRLFYVAVTRAEKYLDISYCKFKTDGREIEPSMFITEIQEQHPHIRTEPIKVTDEDILAFSELQFKEMSPEIEKLEKSFADALLANFTMNVTALNNYLKCPLEFYFKNLLRIPSPKNEATEFGSAVHYALEQLFRKMQTNNDAFQPKTNFIGDFEWYMHRHRESFTAASFSRRMEAGREILSNYYDRYIHTWNKVVSVERNIRNVVVDGVPLKGKLDKLEFEGRQVNVVDYKTGDPEKGMKKMNAPTDKEPNGGDYWRQAVFYKILLDNYTQKEWKVLSSEFDFVEPDNKKNYHKEKIIITPEDVTTVRQQIQSTWQKIQAHDFYNGCGKEDCHWCNFVKSNSLAVALHEIEEEE